MAPQSDLLGMDVYHLDGVIDWPVVAKSGISFSMLKATQGTALKDTQFSANRSGCNANGITSDAYHFYIAADDPVKQADFFCSTIGTISPNEFAPSLDLEEGTFPKDGNGNPIMPPGKTVKQVVADIMTFLQEVDKITGQTPLIYTNFDTWFYVLNNPTNFTQFPLWLADYSAMPKLFGGWTSWAFLQYTGSGTVKGNPNIGGTDLNRYNWESGIL